MTPTDTRIDSMTALGPIERAEMVPGSAFSSLLGSQEDLGLTLDESKELAAYQRSLVILGPAGGAVMLCPGNQVGTPPEQRCAYSAKCPLLRAGKAPRSEE